MMQVFLSLNVDVDNPAGTLEAADVSRFVDYEADAYGHWMFQGASSAVLTALGGTGKALTPQGTLPTYGADYIGVSTVQGDALQTDMEEVADQDDTLVAIVKPIDISGLHILAGTLDTETGGSMFFSGAEPARKMGTTTRGETVEITSSTNSNDTVTHTDWYFVAMARDFAGSLKRVRQLLGGDTVVETTAPGGVVYVPATAGRKIGLGQNYYPNGGTADTMSVAEFILYDRALSADELGALYVRRKAVMAGLGITVV